MGRGGALVFLYGAAEGTEEYTYARTRASIRALLDLAPKEARVLRDGREITVPAERSNPATLSRAARRSAAYRWRYQLRISSLDESPVTGESVPVDKGPGMKVFAASINRQGALEIEATAAFADNTLSKIIHLVEEAQERKGKAQQWIERFGRRYTPAVLAVSAFFLFSPWLFDLSWEDWSLRAVVLLVAAGPLCAHHVHAGGHGRRHRRGAGKRGILIKGGAHLEHLGSNQVVAFDKTGTLTHGAPRWPMSSRSTATTAGCCHRRGPRTLLRTSAGAAIVEAPAPQASPRLTAEAFEALTGAGVKARFDGEIGTWQSRSVSGAGRRPQGGPGAHRGAPERRQDRGAGG